LDDRAASGERGKFAADCASAQRRAGGGGAVGHAGEDLGQRGPRVDRR
jgi:hypothetical protein